MNVSCQHCKTKLNIPDHKISPDRDTVFKCPKCSKKITVKAVKAPKPSSTLSFEDRKNALICIDDPELRKTAFSVIKPMGFNVEVAIDIGDALDRMEYHIYHLVIIDDSFDRNRGPKDILKRMDVMDMSLRRRICLVLVSSRVSSNDHMTALHSSVNSIIHIEDIVHLDSFLTQALTDHHNLYMVYNDSLRQAGKV